MIFLDIDGVLNNLTYMRKNPTLNSKTALDPKNIAELNGLIAWTQAKVVISSNWRLDMSLTELRRILADQGFDGDIIGRTPELPGAERHEEIRAWLEMTKYIVDKFVILDDMDMGPYKSYLVRTTFSSGLTDSEVTTAARKLLI